VAKQKFVAGRNSLDRKCVGADYGSSPQSPPAGSNFITTDQSAVTAFAGGTITLDGGTVKLTQTVVNNAAFAALQAIAVGAKVDATNVTVQYTNLAAQATSLNVNFAVNALNGGVVNLVGGQITSIGTANPNSRGYGINAESGGIANANGVTIQTFGQDSHGVVAAGGTINLMAGSVTTNGQSAIGLQANGNAGPSFITAQGTKIMTTGFIAFGATLDGANASTISLKDVALSTTGSGASGLAILGNPPLSTANQFTADNTMINTRGDGIFWFAQSNANVDLKNGTTINPGSGTLLNVVPAIGSPTLNLVADGNVTLNGNVLARGNSIVNINLLNNSVLTGAIQNATNISIQSGSTWNITDTSTVTRNVSVNQGTLAFKSGPKFASTGTASVLNIGGNYAMHSTLSLGVGGTKGDQYDRLQVVGDASVSGTLNVSSLNNFHPLAGNAFAILLAAGGRSGQFAQINDSLNNNPNLERIDVYAPNGIALAYVPATTPIPPVPGPSPTPNPRPPIDIVVPDPLPPVNPDEPVPPSFLRFLFAALDPTVEQLTSMFEIPFSGANTQRFNLTDRMTQIQQGSTGFVSPIAPAPPPVPTGKEIGKKEVVPPALVPGPTNRWGVWVNGWGDWVNVNGDNGVKGYNFTTGGVSVGVDYRITDYLAIGLFGTYAHTWTSLNPGSIDVNTGRGGLYVTYWNQGFYINGAVYAGHNSYDTSRGELTNTLASGSTSGYEVSTFVDTGYNFHFGDLSFGPVFAAQYTNVHVDGFTEQGSFLPLNIHSDSEESWRTDLGLLASYACHVGNIIVIPSLSAAWEHEYKYSNLPIAFSSPIFGGVSATVFGPHEGHDSAIINAGVGTQWTPRIATYVSYQGQLGRNNYDANGVTGTISFSF
jgi:uncharacterized protein YhjY with autotransporter beta-barrel domain